MTEFNFEALYSKSAADRVGSMGQRRWGQAGMLAPIKYSFEGGMPDPSTYPMEGIADATRRVCMTDRLALNYGALMGFDGFRDQVVRLESIFPGRKPTRDDVLITSGASQALQLIYAAFINPGDTVILEEQSYVAQQIRVYHPNVVTVPMDEHGYVVAEFRKLLVDLTNKGIRPKLFYTVTGFHNPLGISFRQDRYQAALDLAKEFGFVIVEDDPYSRIRFAGDDVPSMYSMDDTGRYVIRTGTVSKILGAGLRLGWVIAHPDILRVCTQFKQDGGTNPFAQRVAAEFWKDNLWSHIKVVTASYKHKRDTMVAALKEHCRDLSDWNMPDGGIFLWVNLHKDVDDVKLNDVSAQESVAYRPGVAFASDPAKGKGVLRLAYSFQDPETITEGIKRLGRAMHAAAD
ncbi:MAG: PLP-dependent aminotransferase family protein [Chloroflexi bacterium]|nr:PLP-dependent aminotransferase family protein [Chloroflexota bacterium]